MRFGSVRQQVHRADPPSFERVLQDAKAGDEDATSILYLNYVPVVYGYLRVCGARRLEDLTSEVFLEMMDGLPEFTGGQQDFERWLMSITLQLADQPRQTRGNRDAIAEPSSLGGFRTSPVGIVPRATPIDEPIIAAVGQLTDSQREVLALRFLADVSPQGVAAITGRPPGAVEISQSRGLESLRRQLRADEDLGRLDASEAPDLSDSPILGPDKQVLVTRFRTEFRQRPPDRIVATHVMALQQEINVSSAKAGRNHPLFARAVTVALVVALGTAVAFFLTSRPERTTFTIDRAADAPVARQDGVASNVPEELVRGLASNVDSFEAESAANEAANPDGSADGGRDSTAEPDATTPSASTDLDGSESSLAETTVASDPDSTSPTTRPSVTDLTRTTLATSTGDSKPSTSTTSPKSTTTSTSSKTSTSLLPGGATCDGLTVTIVGTPKDDVLRGTEGPDVIDGGGGQDVIHGLGGDDTICGGDGRDELYGGPGDDYLSGGNEKDLLVGGDGTDILDGGNGPDELIP